MRTDWTSSRAPAIASFGLSAPAGAAEGLTVVEAGPAVAPRASKPLVLAAGGVAGVCPVAAVAAGGESGAADERFTSVSLLFGAGPEAAARTPVISTW